MLYLGLGLFTIGMICSLVAPTYFPITTTIINTINDLLAIIYTYLVHPVANLSFSVGNKLLLTLGLNPAIYVIATPLVGVAALGVGLFVGYQVLKYAVSTLSSFITTSKPKRAYEQSNETVSAVVPSITADGYAFTKGYSQGKTTGVGVQSNNHSPTVEANSSPDKAAGNRR